MHLALTVDGKTDGVLENYVDITLGRLGSNARQQHRHLLHIRL